MAKIRGWKNIGDNTWRNEKNPELFVSFYKDNLTNYGLYWRVQTNIPGYEGDSLSSTNKDEARKDAIRMMKRFPYG